MISVSGKSWEEKVTNKNSIEKIKQDYNFSNILSKLIVSRKFDQTELSSIDNHLDLNNVFLKNNDFDKSIELVTNSINNQENICILGDYDVDGSAATSLFVRFFEKNGFTNIIFEDRDKLDLCSKTDTFEFFQRTQPEIVILAAGKVGGIISNRDCPADFISENLSIQLNVFNASLKYKVKKLIFFGSSCMYPKISSQPMRENLIGSGLPEETSIGYATAKNAGVQMCHALNRQYNMTYKRQYINRQIYNISLYT